jgi:hypothetical protein
MDKRYQVFVSSTYTDLLEERRHVIQTLLEMNCIPSGMELFPAADEEQWQFIRRVIDDCDYYILIIGGRYGSVTAEGVSYTEKEYDYAVERGLDVLACVHSAPDEIAVGKSDITPELRSKLEAFREKVKTGRIVKFWTHAKDLPGLVAVSLGHTIRTHPGVGWVRANQVVSAEILDEMNVLRGRNEALRAGLERLESRQATVPELATMEESAELHGRYTESRVGQRNVIDHLKSSFSELAPVW